MNLKCDYFIIPFYFSDFHDNCDFFFLSKTFDKLHCNLHLDPKRGGHEINAVLTFKFLNWGLQRKPQISISIQIKEIVMEIGECLAFKEMREWVKYPH